VVVVGGKNSAAIAALELWRGGARVTLVHREAEISYQVKYWIKPDIEKRIADAQIHAYFNSQLVEITADTVIIETPQGREILKNDFVFAMTGYHPDFQFLESMGIRFHGEERRPLCNSETLESNVPGIYLAGVIVAGARTNEIFIENGRFHGEQIVAALMRK
jgi:thioredoxin reductase (NADPH)